MYLLGGLLMAYGVASIVAISLAKRGRKVSMLGHIVGDFSGMPPLMKKLALVQFFTWSALFIMWINTTPVVAQYFFDAPTSAAPRFQEAGQWVDKLFGTYNAVAAVAALTLLPWLSSHIGKAKTHVVGLLCGATGFASFFFIRDPHVLIASEVGIGIAWASILAMPYAILASSLPQRKLGIYMGLFNVFVVVPQLLVATVMGSIMKYFFPNDPIWTMAFAAGVMLIAAVAMLRVKEASAAWSGTQVGSARRLILPIERGDDRPTHVVEVRRRVGAEDAAEHLWQMGGRITAAHEDIMVEHRAPCSALIGR